MSKPNFFITTKINPCLAQSKALAISNFITIPHSPLYVLACMASCTKIMLSKIWHPSIKPPWFSDIIFGRIFFTLLAKILLIILYPALQREIGLNLEKSFGLNSLEIKAENEELVPPPMHLVLV